VFDMHQTSNAEPTLRFLRQYVVQAAARDSGLPNMRVKNGGIVLCLLLLQLPKKL
jgi:hypothetical protein